MPSIILCPDPGCGASAEILNRWIFTSSSGPVEHVRTRCAGNHIFTPTVGSLVASLTARADAEPVVVAGAFAS